MYRVCAAGAAIRCNNKHRWLWVPAFAGTTRGEPGRCLRRPGLVFLQSLLDGEHPHDAALRHVVPEPTLALTQRHLLAGKAAAEILVGGNVDQAGLLTIRRRRPVLAAPQGRTEFHPLAHDRLVSRVDDGFASLRLDALPDVGMN